MAVRSTGTSETENAMIEQRMIGQPGRPGAPVRNSDAIVDLVRVGAASFDAAVAYVTDSGVDALLSNISSSGVNTEWTGLTKRFLVSIDWYRSDPTALERLAALPAAVRVHDGSRVVDRPGCVPFVPWHPKWFSVHGSSVRGHLVGSGNLSRNGLVFGHEAGTLQIVRKPSHKIEKVVDAAIRAGEAWFENSWSAATPLSTIIDKYRRGFTDLPKTELARNDDVADVSGRVGTRHGLTADQLAALTSATNFWIEGEGGISKNRGPSRAGNQLNMSALMRVFFGGSADEVPRNSALVTVTLEHPSDQTMSPAAPIRFSDNSMDVITLPVPESPWPTSYDDRVLLFTKVTRDDALRYVLTVRSKTGARTWRSASTAQRTSFSMRSGRRWGVFG
jgi:HKD family nuclease